MSANPLASHLQYPVNGYENLDELEKLACRIPLESELSVIGIEQVAPRFLVHRGLDDHII
jgi:hypothetical protein